MQDVSRILDELRETASPRAVLSEALAHHLGLTEGHVTIELRLQDGRFVKAYWHRGPFGRSDVETVATG